MRLPLLASAVLTVAGLSCKGEPGAPPASAAPAEERIETSTVARTATVGSAVKEQTGPRYAKATIENNLEAAMVAAVGAELGPALAQVTTRVLVWWVDPRNSLWKGDTIEVIYEPRALEEPLLHAVWFRSSKAGRSFEAVRYVPEGAEFARYYAPDGEELEMRLKGGPIDRYEQITSLLRDGRGHKGCDFKAPEGTPIVAPFDGRVVRKNWATRTNGYCVEIEDARGTTAAFLHLSRVDRSLAPGSRVRQGAVIGQSGNTGRSTAPHLHYQLMRGNRLIDPFQFHPTWRARLPDAQLPKLRSLFERYRALRTSVS